VGLNLTAAPRVGIYDSDWNPRNGVQERCHHIGQTRDVQIDRLVTRRMYESEMVLRTSMKLGFDFRSNAPATLSTNEVEGS
jgi:SNF2 family DNA or RNA helicase